MTAPYLSLRPLVPWKNLPRPIDWPALFGRDAPLELEIGCGNGEVLLRRALARPDLNLVGLDHGWPSVRRVLRRIGLAGVDNVRVMQTEAWLALERLFAPGAISRADCFFPRPWPKPRQAKHRLLNQRFLRLLNSRLTPEGSLRLISDYRPYVDWVLEQMPGTGFSASPQTVGPGLDSKYERKWQDQGIDEFFELQLTKVEHLAWPLPEEPELHYPALHNFDPANLSPFEDLGEIKIMLKDAIYDPARDRAMLRMVVLEADLEQAFYLEVVPEGQGHLLRPAPGCGVLPSLGIQRAMEMVARRLEGKG
jgi:tRNA (guanine-N7-)-methyltransferase